MAASRPSSAGPGPRPGRRGRRARAGPRDRGRGTAARGSAVAGAAAVGLGGVRVVVWMLMRPTVAGRSGSTVWSVCRRPVTAVRRWPGRAAGPRTGCARAARPPTTRAAVRVRRSPARATGRARRRRTARVRDGVAAGEPLEGAGRQVRRHARAVVVHGEHDLVAVARGRRRSPSCPGGVCRRALVSRLVTTWCSRCSSPVTTTGSSGRSSCQRWSGRRRRGRR